MKQSIMFNMILMFLFFLAGCNRIPSNNTLTAKQQSIPVYQKSGENLVRSLTMYEQFELIGRFAALWVPDSIQSAKGNQGLVFYVLSLSDVHFNEPLSEWQISLKINDQYYQPISIQKVALPFAYQSFFGSHLWQYKIVNLITFKRIDEKGALLLQPNSSMKLEINFEDRQGHLVWNFNENNILMPHFESHCRKGN